MLIALDQLSRACAGAPVLRLATILGPLNASLDDADVSTPLRASMWLAQLSHESADFSRFVEGLNYSAEALVELFPRHFDRAAATLYARQPQRIANRLYAGRLGNGDEQGGDGWKFRGRGPIQLTGAAAYLEYGRALGVDLIGRPELLEDPALGFRAAARFWRVHEINTYADKGNVPGATRAINGGLNNLSDRQARYARARAAFGISLQPSLL